MAPGLFSPPFLASLSEAGRDRCRSRPDLEQRLGELLKEAQKAWPGVALSPDLFFRHLAERGDGQLEGVRASELYLARAAAEGDPAALTSFETTFFPELEGALASMKLPAAKRDDVKQILRRDLFLSPEGGRPKIASYDGRGELRGWLRVTAVRAALKVLRKERHDLLVEDDQLFDRAAPDDDLELAQIRKQARELFKEAFTAAVSTLSSRDQNLLRQQVLDGLSIDELGKLYQVHRATAARWLEQARAALLAETRRILTGRMGLTAGECDSLLRIAPQELDLTISRILRRP